MVGSNVDNSVLSGEERLDNLQRNVTKPAQTASNELAPAQERLPASQEAARYDLSQMDEVKKKAVLLDLRTGLGVVAIAKKHGLSDHVVSELRRKDDDERSIDMSVWKRHTAATLSHFVAQGGTRLVDEVQNIPLSQLPVAIAIAIDKLALLHDQPQTVVEHRLRITQEQVQNLILDDCIEVDPLPVVVATPITDAPDVTR